MQPGLTLVDKWTGFAFVVLLILFISCVIISLHHMWITAVFHAMGPMSNATVAKVASAIYPVCAHLGIVRGTEPSPAFLWTVDVVLPLTVAIVHFVVFSVIFVVVIVSMSRDHEPGKKKN